MECKNCSKKCGCITINNLPCIMLLSCSWSHTMSEDFIPVDCGGRDETGFPLPLACYSWALLEKIITYSCSMFREKPIAMRSKSVMGYVIPMTCKVCEFQICSTSLSLALHTSDLHTKCDKITQQKCLPEMFRQQRKDSNTWCTIGLRWHSTTSTATATPFFLCTWALLYQKQTSPNRTAKTSPSGPSTLVITWTAKTSRDVP